MATSGIGAIRNIENNKIFAFKSINLEKQWEIHRNQLNLNIHYNKSLQKDWQSLGSEKFEFNIIEQIDDVFDLDDGFVDYVIHLEKNYNDFNISSFYFEYLGQNVLIKLYNLIGRDECSPEFLDKLQIHDLSVDVYDEIKDEMISLIEDEDLSEDEIEDRLNELVLDKSHDIRVYNLDMQYKLINDLEDIIGIAELNEEFKQKLTENGFIEDTGFLIQEKIMEMIFSNDVLDNDIKKQIDSCIEILKQRVSKENIIKLLQRADDLKEDEGFKSRLQSSDLPENASLKIINQLKEFIKSGIVNEDNFSQKLDELIDIEIENQWLKTKNELLDYLNTCICSNEITQRLNSFYIDSSLILPIIYQSITGSIENKEITSNEEIDSHINGIIDREISRITNLRDELLAYLNDTYGCEQLTGQFITRLTEAKLDIEDGKEFILQLSNEISSFKISSIEQIDKTVDQLIFDRNKFILSNLFNQLIGKDDDNESFSQKLKFNYLTDADGTKIRNDLLKLIDSQDNLEGVLDLRNTLEYRLDEMIGIQGELNYKKLVSMYNELIKSLNEYVGDNQINESFKKKLYSNNLGEEYWDEIKNEIARVIEKEPQGPDFELKMNQLEDLKNKGVTVVVDEIVEREAEIRNDEYKSLKSNLISQLNDLIGVEENTTYYNDLLAENHLGIYSSSNIRNDFDQIIVSDEVYDDYNFNYKYEELLFVENKTINKLLLDLVQKQKNIYNKELSEVRTFLMNEVNVIIGENTVEDSFRNRLYSNQLSLDYAETFKKSMKDFINSDKIYEDQFNFKLDELMDLKETGVEYRLNKLIEDESQIKLNELNNLKKELTSQLNQLTDEDKFKDALKSNNLSSQIGIEIKDEINTLINSKEVIDSKFNYKLEELNHLNEKTVSLEIDELIQKHSVIYDENLSDVRINIHGYVDSIIGENKVNDEFKVKLHDNYLHESFANEIKSQMNIFIDSDEVYGKGYEFKLDELKDLSFEDIENRIDEIIEDNRTVMESELKEVQSILNDDLINLIGESENNEYYNGLLKSHNLNHETGEKIRFKIYDLINSPEVLNHGFEFKLDELLALKDKGIENYLNEIVEKVESDNNEKLKNIRQKLLDCLNSFTSKDSFKEMLHSKQIDDSYTDVINKKLTDFINTDKVVNDVFEVKLDELVVIERNGIEICIDQLVQNESDLRQKELGELKSELLDKLYSVIGRDENNLLFNSKLVKNNLNDETREKIRKELIDLISSTTCQDSKFKYKLAELKHLKQQGVENKVDEVVKREAEIYNKALKEKRESLIDLVDLTVGKNKTNISLKHKLKSNGLDESFADVIKQELIDFITTDTVENKNFKVKLDELTDFENKGIDVKIDEIIKKQLDRQTSLLKEKLLKQLYHITGNIPLSEEFTAKLYNVDFDEEFGIKIVYHFKSEINSLNIKEGFDFEKAIDEMIYDESKNILLKQTYEIIGRKSNSDYFIKKLKINMISTSMAEDIRSELLSMIEGADLDALTDLRRVTMQTKFDEIISREHDARAKKLDELREKLLKELNDRISSTSFKSELQSKNLSTDYIDKIKNELEEFIKSDEVEGDFEFKVDELIDLDNKGINNKIDEIVTLKSNEINTKFEALKKQLLSDLEINIWPLDNSIKFGARELNKRNLTISTGKKAYSELKDLISSSQIKDSKFTSKYEELENLKKITVNTKFIEIIEEYSKHQQELIKFLKSQTIENDSFNQRLRRMNLDDDFADGLIKNIEIKIKDNEYTEKSDVLQAVNHYINEEAVEQEKAFDKLYNIIGKRGISLKFRAKLMLKGLSSSDGKRIAQTIEKKIKTEGLRVNDVLDELEKQLNDFSKKSDAGSAQKDATYKYVFCSECGHKNINGSNFCEECGARLIKL